MAQQESAARTRSIVRGPAGVSDPAGVREAAEPEALSVTHWFDAGEGELPYRATVRFEGRHLTATHGRTGKTRFTQDEAVDGVVPGSGPVAVTTWAYGLEPGEWSVTAVLVSDRGHPARASAARRATLPRAAWSWRRWQIGAGPFSSVATRWAGFVRLTRMPAVLPGSWIALITFGILAAIVLQAAFVASLNIGATHALMIDGVALLAGVVGAKLWYVALKPDTWRRRFGEGWSVDGLLVAAPLAGLASLRAHEFAIGAFLDATTPALFLGVAIGRLGCFFTGCCAGRLTGSWIGIWSSDRRVGARRIPTQLFESGGALAIAVASLLALSVGNPSQGAVFVGALAAYVIVRQRLLRLRAEPRGFSSAAWLTVAGAVLVLFGDVLLQVAG